MPKSRRPTDVILQLNRLDLGSVEYGYVKALVGELLHRVPLVLSTTQFVRPIFRAIIYVTKPNEVAELGYPPARIVTGFQRCNSAGNPMFYGSTDPVTPFVELMPKPGSKVYRSKWSVIGKVTIYNVAGWDGAENQVAKTRETDIVTTYLKTIFSAPVHEAFTSRHKITAAFADTLQGQVTGRDGAELGVLVYPSVADPAQASNFCFHPRIADSQLRLDYVEEIMILDPREHPKPPPKGVDQYFAAQYCDFADKFENGQIIWKGRPRRYDLGKTDATMESHRGGEVFAWGPNGEFIDPN